MKERFKDDTRRCQLTWVEGLAGIGTKRHGLACAPLGQAKQTAEAAVVLMALGIRFQHVWTQCYGEALRSISIAKFAAHL